MKYLVQIVGKIWNGQTCGHEYQAVNEPRDYADIKRLAGDFNIVDDYQVITVTHKTKCEGSKTVTTHTAEIIRPWENEASEATFYDCAGE